MKTVGRRPTQASTKKPNEASSGVVKVRGELELVATYPKCMECVEGRSWFEHIIWETYHRCPFIRVK